MTLFVMYLHVEGHSVRHALGVVAVEAYRAGEVHYHGAGVVVVVAVVVREVPLAGGGVVAVEHLQRVYVQLDPEPVAPVAYPLAVVLHYADGALAVGDGVEVGAGGAEAALRAAVGHQRGLQRVGEAHGGD